MLRLPLGTLALSLVIAAAATLGACAGDDDPSLDLGLAIDLATASSAAQAPARAIAPEVPDWPAGPENFSVRTTADAANQQARAFRWITQPAAAGATSATSQSQGGLGGVLGGPGVPSPPTAPIDRDELIEAARAALAVDAPADLVVDKLHDTGTGALVVRFGAQIAGLPVFAERVSVLLARPAAGTTQGPRPVAVTGGISPAATAAATGDQAALSKGFTVPVSEALGAAVRDMTGLEAVGSDAVTAVSTDLAGFARYALESAALTEAGWTLYAPVRSRSGWFTIDGAVAPAYHLELALQHPVLGVVGRAYIVGARDGALLLRNSLVHDLTWQFRVWADPNTLQPFDNPQGDAFSPHPAGAPDGSIAQPVAQELVEIDDGFNATKDPWLAPDAVVTSGNNVDAYADLAGNDGFSASGDLRSQVSEDGVFDWPFDPDQDPQGEVEQIYASITQLFYVNNYLHDVFYDLGFDEAAGNAQVDNYGRGGAPDDAILAEGQDQSGFNNANMYTPADGSSPRMQMFLYDYANRIRTEIVSPSSLAGLIPSRNGGFSPGWFDITGILVEVDDGDSGGGTETFDGCQAVQNDVAGKVAMVSRGDCNFVEKVKNAQNAGAIGVIVANNRNNDPNGLMTMGGSDGSLVIPALFVSTSTGDNLRSWMASQGPLTMRLLGGPLRDGTIDNQVVTHEWGHYMFGRLTSVFDGATNQTGSINEGNGDFVAMLLSVREHDAQLPGNGQYQGAYPMSVYTSGDSYFGIRRTPYSTAFSRNPFTLAHISAAAETPTGAPIQQTGASYAEVHNAGEIWANVMWECYAALLNEHDFAEARTRMMTDLVVALKLFPPDATFVEARDAVLAASVARDPAGGDFVLYWTAFAKRGFGIGAVAPDRHSFDHVGVVESFDLGGDIAIEEFALQADTLACDGDQYLDLGERGVLSIRLSNVGAYALDSPTVTVRALSTSISVPRAGVVFPDGDTIAAPGLGPLQSATVEIPVALTQAIPFDSLLFEVEVSDPAAAFPREITRTFLANLDEVANGSRTDDVESTSTTWTAQEVPEIVDYDGWQIAAADGRDHRWVAPDLGTMSDLRLVSPELQVSTDEDLVIRFEHRYRFEHDAAAPEYFDGGVLELRGEGTGWVDIGVLGSPSYDGTVANLAADHGADQADNNALADRAAYVGRSADFPELTPVVINLGREYAGQIVQVRFRLATDPAIGDDGWQIDNFSVAGTDNMPFGLLAPDAGVCVAQPTADAGDDLAGSVGNIVTLDGSGSVASEPGLQLSYSWVQIAGPGVTVTGPTTVSPAFVAPSLLAAATLTFQLVVADGTGLSEADTVDIAISADPDAYDAANPPVVEGGSDHTHSPALSGGGCAASQSSGSPGAPLTLLVAAALLVLRRRR